MSKRSYIEENKQCMQNFIILLSVIVAVHKLHDTNETDRKFMNESG